MFYVKLYVHSLVDEVILEKKLHRASIRFIPAAVYTYLLATFNLSFIIRGPYIWTVIKLDSEFSSTFKEYCDLWTV